METTNLNKSLKEIFSGKYIVPLYQRNYAWSEEEIAQLLQDLYENFKKAENSKDDSKYDLNYFIGSLVVLKRKDGYFEVIDGQQRLTTLSILLKLLNLVDEPKLFYESRPEVEAFFDSFYRNADTSDVTFTYKVSHLVHAVDLLNETVVNPDEAVQKTLSEIPNLDGFKKFILANVILVRVEIPTDTDVASYFEIMNNRGEQLQKHEILKSYLMDSLKDENGNHYKNQQEEFSKIWDACSQMDVHIQKLFSVEDRRKYFGVDFNGITDVLLDDNASKENKSFTINTVLNAEVDYEKTDNISDVDDIANDQAIIDFSNFLMHIFKLKYQSYTEKGNDLEIPLNEKDLLTVYNGIKEKIDVKDFINDLLYYRTVFDRFIVKATEDEEDEESYKWTLQNPYRYFYQKRNTHTLKYKNTFENQERLIKAISMLQVSFRNRKYKNWLQDVLRIFKDRKNFNISLEDYQRNIDQWILEYFESHITEENYDTGVRVPHFLFNFIDYLYWVRKNTDFDFKFTYRNSVEHHLPQSFQNEINAGLMNNLGNLCLISKSSNSKMNNEHPVGKAKSDGKYYRQGKLPSKQKVMYDITNKEGKWGNIEIMEHRENVVSLLDNRNTLLVL